jgi:hypothetical protein
MSDQAVHDIENVLRILFRESVSIERDTLERMIAFDMEWLSPSESEQAVEQFIAKGWLELNDAICHLKRSLSSTDLPLGWFPRPTHLLHPPSATQETSHSSPPRSFESPLTQPKTIDVEQQHEQGMSAREHQTKRLFSYLARSSGLPKDELQRRSERKQHALRYLTEWMALTLIAKELGLAMDDIVAVFQS